MGDIFGLTFPFFALIAVGYLAGRLIDRPVEGLAWLNIFIIYIALPALFFQLLSETPVEDLASGGFILATTFGTFAVFAAVFAIGFFKSGRDVPSATIQGLAAAYGNIGYMGPGLALAAFGPGAVAPVALIFCFDNSLHFVMAPLLMALGGESRGKAGAIILDVLAKIFTHPFILATIFGIAAALLELSPPAALDRLIGLAAQAAAPCALFAMGVTLALRPLRRAPPELGFIVPFKLLAHPLIVYAVLGLAGDFDPVWVQTAILLATLPTATNVFVIAQQYGVWIERASAAVLVTTVLSIFTVTGWLFLMTSGSIPADPFPN